MSIYYRHLDQTQKFGRARVNQPVAILDNNFSSDTIRYLDEKIINYLLDSMSLDGIFNKNHVNFNDYSFVTAPAYKALEGFLFQIAKDLKLPSSGNEKLAGSYYFDEEKIDKHIDKLLKELGDNTQQQKALSKYEKQDIKDRIKEMKGFLQHYRHTPAHFYGEPIDTIEKAHRNIMIIYGAIDNTAQILLKAKLLSISNIIH